jgi:outer membrane immunogenic protein
MKEEIWAGLVATMTLIGPGYAADLPTRAAAPAPYLAPAPVHNWSGFYVGANAGVAWGAGCDAVLPNFPGIPVGWVNTGCGFGGESNATFIGGVQAGVNFQSGSFVYGLETDIAGPANSNKQRNVNFAAVLPGVPIGNYTFAGSRDPNVLGTVRLRLGHAADRSLFYVTGGISYGSGSKSLVVNHFLPSGTLNGTWASNSSGSGIGWAVGLGYEYAATENWTIKAEYLTAGLRNKSTNAVICSGPCVGINPALAWAAEKRPTIESVFRVGVNYKFGGSGNSVVARY